MIDLSCDGNIWVITLNRPAKANSLTPDMLRQLIAIIGDAHQAGSDVRAVILTGSGTVFSAGADLDAARAGLATSPLWEDLSTAIATLPCMTIAALNGTFAGGAMGMVLACDLRISVASAKAFYPVMKLGFLPQPSDPKRMCALMGPARTKLMLMGGQKITAQDALAFGLIDQIVGPEDLIATAHSLAADTAAAAYEIATEIKKICVAM
jgi:enoyl-CoA hydratase/carnithine racemase